MQPSREPTPPDAQLLLKILYFNHTSVLSGSAWSLLQIVQRLDRKRFEPVVALRRHGPLETALRESGVDVLVDDRLTPAFALDHDRFDMLAPLRSAYWMRAIPRGVLAAERITRRVQPDVVHINSSVLFHLAEGVRRGEGPKTLMHVREHWGLSPDDRRAQLRDACVSRFVDRIAGITHGSIRHFGFEERSDVVPNWPDFGGRDQSLDLAAAIGAPENAKLIVDMGGRHPHKGALVSAQAMSQIDDPKARLIVMGGVRLGEGALKRVIRGALRHAGARTYGLRLDRLAERSHGRVCLLPLSPCVKSVFEQAYAVVCPFPSAHFAKPAIEAGALGKPVILVDSDEARETVRHGETGLIVDRPHPGAVAAALNEILADPAQARRMGESAKRFVDAHFSAEQSMATLTRLYMEMAQ